MVAEIAIKKGGIADVITTAVCSEASVPRPALEDMPQYRYKLSMGRNTNSIVLMH